MSDIHGQYEAYLDILEQISFENFSKRDKLYILGDVIDRGLDSIKILQHIKSNQDKISLLMGNHELMMVESYPFPKMKLLYSEKAKLWTRNGGETTYAEFSELSRNEQGEILDFLRNLPYHKIIQVNNQKYYLVHAMPYHGKTSSSSNGILSMSKRKQMLWGMFESYENKNVTVLFGHRCVALYDPKFRDNLEIPEHFEIYQEDNYIAVDCGCAYRNKLSRLGCIRLQDGAKFYGKLKNFSDSVYW